MLNNIIKFSLKNRYFVLLCSSLLIVFGIRAVTEMEVDVFPDLTAPTVVVMTDARGMASEEVERLVTFPIETAVNGATDVRRVRSSSAMGYSFVWVEFDWGTDIFRARQIVSEKLITISSEMPLGVGQPELAPQSSVMGEIFFIGLQSDSTSLMDLRTIAEWDVKPLILATGGVSQVTVIGGDEKQYQVLADPLKMQYFNVSMHELAEVCRNISSNSTGGVLREYGNEYVIRGIARTSDTALLGNTFIKSVNGLPVKVSDVARVTIGSAPKMGYSSGNGKPAVIISVSRQPDANTLLVTENIESNLEGLKQTLPDDIKLDTSIFRQADFIETAINNVKNTLLEGALFVVIILFIFLGSFRTTLISLLAVPLSLLGTVLVIKALGMTINTMSLGGMAIAIGSLVDDAIIDVENVYKRLRQNRLLPADERRDSFDVVFEASREIRASILNATLIIMVAFIPLFFLSGMEGRMLKPLGISFVVSLFVSLIVAMTLTPLLAKMLLSDEKYLERNKKEKWLAGKMAFHYEKSLEWALKYKKPVIYITSLLFVVSVLLLSSFGRSFLPDFNEGSLTLSVVTRQGLSLDENNRLGNTIENELLKIPEITSTARRTGRGELDEHSQTSNSAEIDVNYILNDRNREDFLAEVRSTLSSIPGIAYNVGQPLAHRIDHMLTGTKAGIAIKIFGNDLNRLYELANRLNNSLTDIEGLVDITVEQQTSVPQLQIKANREMLAAYGITMEEFNEFTNVGFAGGKMTEIFEGQRSFDLILRLDQSYTSTMEGMKSALIDTDDGRKIPLEQIAEIVSTTGPGSVSRENVQRRIIVSANVTGRDLRSVVEDIKARVEANMILPEGYRIEYGGQFESEAAASRTLMLASVLAIVVIFLLLFQEFRDLKLSGIILLNLPLALIGGVFAIWITSGVLSIPAMIGFISLFGIATRNGILLISNYQKLSDRGVPLHETIIKGSGDRLNAIMMTALTAALALIPLAVRGNMSGNEIQSPMAKVILGGLITSTLLNIYIIPIFYQIFSKNKKEVY